MSQQTQQSHLDKNSSHDTALKQYENQINAKIRRLETRISELQRTNEDHLHLKVISSVLVYLKNYLI